MSVRAMIIRHARQFFTHIMFKVSHCACYKPLFCSPSNRLWLFVSCWTSKSSKLHRESIFLQVVQEGRAAPHSTFKMLQLSQVCALGYILRADGSRQNVG